VTVTISVDYVSVTVSNGIDPYVRVPISPVAISSPKNIFYASNLVADNLHISAGGKLENMKIEGKLNNSFKF
jgi:hypothetical protein